MCACKATLIIIFQHSVYCSSMVEALREESPPLIFISALFTFVKTSSEKWIFFCLLRPDQSKNI